MTKNLHKMLKILIVLFKARKILCNYSRKNTVEEEYFSFFFCFFPSIHFSHVTTLVITYVVILNILEIQKSDNLRNWVLPRDRWDFQSRTLPGGGPEEAFLRPDNGSVYLLSRYCDRDIYHCKSGKLVHLLIGLLFTEGSEHSEPSLAE